MSRRFGSLQSGSNDTTIEHTYVVRCIGSVADNFSRREGTLSASYISNGESCTKT
jgi:hypothetical protein